MRARMTKVGVVFQHCTFFFSIFQKTFLEKKIEKNFVYLFYFNFFNIISEKKVKIFFFQIFFQKLNFYFSKKAKLATLCHHLGKAHVKSELGAAPTWYILCTLVLLKKNSTFEKHCLKKNIFTFFSLIKLKKLE